MQKNNQNFYFLSVDSSSSSCKVCLINSRTGEIDFLFTESINTYFPKPGWVEHDGDEIYEKLLLLLQKAVSIVSRERIIGIGITNQRESVIAWDKNTLKPVCAVISWQDSRNEDFLHRWRDKEEFIKSKTGLYLNSYFSASKIDWIIKNIDFSWEDIRFGTVDTWLIANLTGGAEFVTDVTNASRTMCMNLEKEIWDLDLLEMFGIPLYTLPTIKPSGSYFGSWRKIPILGVIGDQQAALLSLGSKPGIIKCTYGTGLFVLINSGNKRVYVDNALTTIGWKMEGEKTVYALENGSFVCGNILTKLKNGGFIDNYLIEDNTIVDCIYIEPIDDRLFIFDKKKWKKLSDGIDLSKDRGEIVFKAYLNGLACLTKEMLKCFQVLDFDLNEIYVNGLISTSDYLRKVQSLILNKQIIASKDALDSALGVAYLVGLYSGIITWDQIHDWNSLDVKTDYPIDDFSATKTLEMKWEKYKSSL
ncbi:FGGY family carbohydrate kinase [Candidatus Mycoplasma haematohominis]|uniref:FGGY family carbohydrate kinase n=1 Tax=Candidatus Mycoplasma haematohominis TaxID=1494318 RepID=UPI001C0A7132|nr:FGGY family carbohydrate kinase [Candidatus Mycoplasma haemohominis]